uniref:gamma-glutamylcyclotransferase family protein n=1 Tax=Marinobacterium profundum TaxID=1714300 RepID=UPI0008356BD6|nr:gamma-glutamylcyclotransferase family protein [Marinobacterium profundum]
MNRLFTYGTLMVPEVIETVIGRPAGESLSATLKEYVCYQVRGKAFPAIVPDSGQQTLGRLYQAIDQDALERLDFYEGSLYLRCQVKVQMPDGTKLDAWTYVFTPEACVQLTDQPWQLDYFVERQLTQFLHGCAQPQT